MNIPLDNAPRWCTSVLTRTDVLQGLVIDGPKPYPLVPTSQPVPPPSPVPPTPTPPPASTPTRSFISPWVVLETSQLPCHGEPHPVAPLP